MMEGSEKLDSKSDSTKTEESKDSNDNKSIENLNASNEKVEKVSEKSELDKSNVKDNSLIKNTEIDDERSRYIHYEGDVAVYTDPQSCQQYTWDNESNEWKLRKIDYEYDGTNYFYTDEKTKIKYKWDTTSNKWVGSDTESKDKKESDDDDEEEEEEYDETNAQKTALPVKRQDMSKGTYGYEGDTHTYTDPTDGTIYIWDVEKNAWFPKVDDDFLARYQMSYGFVENTTPPAAVETKTTVTKTNEAPPSSRPETTATSENDSGEQTGQKRKAEPPKWFDVGAESTKVYVSNLPLDLKEEEFVDLMQKCGLVMKDVETNAMKIKLYTDPHTKEFKGDALCTYIKRESIPLALNILDGYELRGKKIKVERATFTMKGNSYDPSLKPKKKKKKVIEKMKKIQEKLFDWRPDKLRGERSKNESVIVVKNLFDPIIFDKEVTLILEYQQDLREECAKCGTVKKVVVYDKHPEGVAQIYFKEPEEADACKELLNNRWFGKRQITAETWDGKSKYKVAETPEEKEARLKKWENYLEEEDRKKKEQSDKEKSDKEADGEKSDSDDEDAIDKMEDEDDVNTKEKLDEADDDNNKDNKDAVDKMEESDDDGNNTDDTKSSGQSEDSE